MMNISGLPSLWLVNAMARPSGDQCGSPTNGPRDRVACHGRDPSAPAIQSSLAPERLLRKTIRPLLDHSASASTAAEFVKDCGGSRDWSIGVRQILFALRSRTHAREPFPRDTVGSVPRITSSSATRYASLPSNGNSRILGWRLSRDEIATRRFPSLLQVKP